MNSKKKIIDTLQNADKASVEKLMAEESKKNEIYAKVMERVSGSSDSDFADEVSGVEHYDRKISMTRIASIAAAAVLCAGGVLGGMHLMNRENKRTGEITSVSVEDLIGSSGETPYIPYEMIMDTDAFKLAFDSFTSPQNPLQLKNGTYEDAVAVKPYNSVVVDDDRVAGTNTVWHFPVVHEDTCLGFINYDTRESDNLAASIYGGQQYADTLNDAIKKGDIAVFITTKGTYGIYEDNTVIKLEAAEDYQGTITFNEVNKDYNLITADYFKNVVYPASAVPVNGTELIDVPVTTSAVNLVEPVTVPVTTEPHDDVPDELTGEFLRERSLNATHYYDKFSADWTSKHATHYADENLNTIYSEYEGTIRIDNTTMTGEYNQTELDIDGTPYDYIHYYFLNNIYITADDYIGTEYIASHKGAEYKSIDNEFLWWWNKPDRVLFEYYGGFKYICMDNGRKRKNGNVDDIINESEWTITGERYENGRRIASVSFSYEQLNEGKYYPMEITADIDVETGIWLAWEMKGDINFMRSSFKATNYKFDDEAEAPMSKDEVIKYLDENEFNLVQAPNY